MKKGIRTKTNNLIALSYIIDEFDSFCIDFTTLVMKSRDIKSISNAIYKMATGARTFADKSIKEFYKKYQAQISNINNHVSVSDFILDAFTEDGYVDPDINAFHKYLLDNRASAYLILDVLYRINKLEINRVILDPEFDFADHVYEIEKMFPKNKALYYVDNIKALPSYKDDIVKYTSTGSNYEIKVVPILKSVCPEESKIRLNTLVFDSNRLPRGLSKYIMFDSIVEQCNELEKDSEHLREAVNIGVASMDLEKLYLSTVELLKKIPDIRGNEKLIEALEDIREGINILSDVSVDYDAKVVDENESVSPTIINNERNAYLIRRNVIKN